MTRILALHAHPDDIETLAAGTLALLAAAGHQVSIVTATAGECGSTQFTPEETAVIRRGEAAQAAAMIGASYDCVGLPDLGVFNDDISRRKVTEAVRAARPDLVITAAPADYHPDHEAISLLVRDACFAASAPNYRTGPAPALAAMPHLYFTDPIGGRDRAGQPVPPQFGVDIGAWLATKRAMLACHRSQTEWLAKQHAVDDPLAAMTALSAKRGRDFGVTQAEGFRQYRHEPYPKKPLLQELIGPALLKVAV
ncbi:LmbE family N-acetylglucosaminyl deacetylase [Caulobacter ginsengisoli]|uniref:LmbE family N-acetylglucosaminyl deacetylase n=1 Tax=Caulobacter ginsengisoli TaxID=400775 RepID=A0ABU0IVW0_9CAUL|nr:PIG-L family deacetylase [Caulobacter ginsengisoli]MDQ0465510.1 LmbE family N-acetylglucosaminyl deacetylase [Caulobacter ginsengisoli]